MFPAGNILGKFCVFSGIALKKVYIKAIIRLKAGLSFLKSGRRIFQSNFKMR
jgi:hypothetical protein